MLVLVLSIMGGYDEIQINYTSVVPDAQVRQDLAALTSKTGWTVQRVHTTTLSSKTPGAKPTTQTTFLAPSIINRTQGLLPIALYIDTLKRFKVIEVDYILAQGMRFGGLQDYENNDVKIQFKQAGNSYTYRITVKNPNFVKVSIPEHAVPRGQSNETGDVSTGARILLIVSISLIGAVLVYLAVIFWSRRRQA